VGVNHRRAFLKAALGGAAGVSLAGLPGTRGFARSRAEPLAIQPVTGHVALVTGLSTNVVLIRAPEGVVVIDGGGADRSGELFKLIQRRAGGAKPVALLNTHWHWDHTGANECFGAAGISIIAHENTRLWLGMEFTVQSEGRDYTPRPRVALPTKVFFRGTQSFELGQRRIEYGWLPRARTDGDIYVRIPDQNVLITGGLFTVGRYPVVDVDTGGWIGRPVSGRIRAQVPNFDEMRRQQIGSCCWSAAPTPMRACASSRRTARAVRTAVAMACSPWMPRRCCARPRAAMRPPSDCCSPMAPIRTRCRPMA
jgi:glyoxylase-like metal-dependent hydrolase (beta-lactamase superfamily II)